MRKLSIFLRVFVVLFVKFIEIFRIIFEYKLRLWLKLGEGSR